MSTLSAQVLATGVLVWDGQGRLLMVKTHNRSTWILPGGIVEAGESPADAGRREVLEEVGLHIQVGRLLAVQHLGSHDGTPSSVQFVFDSEPVLVKPALALQDDEIAEADWLEPDQAITLQSAAGAARLQAALNARSGAGVAFLDASRSE